MKSILNALQALQTVRGLQDVKDTRELVAAILAHNATRRAIAESLEIVAIDSLTGNNRFNRLRRDTANNLEKLQELITRHNCETSKGEKMLLSLNFSHLDHLPFLDLARKASLEFYRKF